MISAGDESAMNLESVTTYISLAALGCAGRHLSDGPQVPLRSLGGIGDPIAELLDCFAF
jgi:hypothetical protein